MKRVRYIWKNKAICLTFLRNQLESRHLVDNIPPGYELCPMHSDGINPDWHHITPLRFDDLEINTHSVLLFRVFFNADVFWIEISYIRTWILDTFSWNLCVVNIAIILRAYVLLKNRSIVYILKFDATALGFFTSLSCIHQ